MDVAVGRRAFAVKKPETEVNKKDKVEIEVEIEPRYKIQQKATEWLQRSCTSKEPKNAEESYTRCSKAQSHL